MHTPSSLSSFPVAKVPVFIGADATKLSESDAIAQYLAESGPLAAQLLGASPLQRAQIRQWISFAESEIQPPVLQLVLPRWGWSRKPFDEGVETEGLALLGRAVGILEGELGTREQGCWVVAEEISLADLSLAGALCWAFQNELDEEARKAWPRVVEWYTRVVEMEKVREVFGPLKFLERRESILAKKA